MHRRSVQGFIVAAVVGALAFGGIGSASAATTRLIDFGPFTQSAFVGYINTPVVQNGRLILRNTNPRPPGSQAYATGVGARAFPAPYAVGDQLQWALLACSPSGSPTLNLGVQNGSGDENTLTVKNQLRPTQAVSWLVSAPAVVNVVKSTIYFVIPGPTGQEVVVHRMLLGDPASIQQAIAADPATGSCVEPTVDAGADRSGTEGASVDVSGSATSAAPLTTTWSATPASGVTGTCAFADPSALETTVSCTDDGTYTLALTASDGRNAPVSDQATLTVENQAPTATIVVPTSVDEGSSFVLALADANDVSPDDMAAGLTFSFDCGTGMGSATDAVSTTCTAPLTGAGGESVTVRGVVADDDGGSTELTATVEILDLMPSSDGECKQGGWASYLESDGGQTFRNQGDCVSWVRTGGRNAPVR